jgi:predicted NACHT family NTPase
MRSTLGDLASTEPPGWLEGKLRAGACTVLLDGLDAVARQEDRAKVSAWAERQIRSYPGNDFLITSRPQGYRAAPVEGADVVQVCGFTRAQVKQFVRGWYLAVERRSSGEQGHDIDVRAEAGAGDLLQRLDHAPGLHELTVNPLLLTMISNVHRYRGKLPGSRAELYAEICQVMIWRRQEAKNLAGEMSGEKKETVLRGLAYAMMQRRWSAPQSTSASSAC